MISDIICSHQKAAHLAFRRIAGLIVLVGNKQSAPGKDMSASADLAMPQFVTGSAARLRSC